MAVESVKKAAADRAKKKALASKVVGVIDTSVEDVLKYSKEGRELLFLDGEKDFLELPEEVVKELSMTSRERYGLAKRITRGEDVVTAMQDGVRGWAKDYNVRPGSASDNLAVLGKKDKYDYYWTTKEKLNNNIAREWEIDRDPDVHTIHEESSTLKTVGGENKPELILLHRKKEASKKYRDKRVEKKERLLGRTKERFVENANKLGVVASMD